MVSQNGINLPEDRARAERFVRENTPEARSGAPRLPEDRARAERFERENTLEAPMGLPWGAFCTKNTLALASPEGRFRIVHLRTRFLDSSISIPTACR